MFDLESAIAEWRQELRAAGIHSAATLEELESHLREELERQARTQGDAAEMFAAAVTAVGRPGELKSEFRKAGGWLSWLGDDGATRGYRVLGVAWLLYCAWQFVGLMISLASVSFNHLGIGVRPAMILVAVLMLVFLRGAVAGVRLCAGKTQDVRILKFIAILGLLGLAALMATYRSVTVQEILLAGFNLVSFWLLRRRRNDAFKPAAN